MVVMDEDGCGPASGLPVGTHRHTPGQCLPWSSEVPCSILEVHLKHKDDKDLSCSSVNHIFSHFSAWDARIEYVQIEFYIEFHPHIQILRSIGLRLGPYRKYAHIEIVVAFLGINFFGFWVITRHHAMRS